MSKEISLTIEQFRDGEESKYLIKSAKEIQLTLHAIALKKSVTVVYFNHAQLFFKSILLSVNEQGIWLDVGANEEENNLVSNSDNFVFVTLHRGVKVQFECHQAAKVIYAAHPAFYFPLPSQMLRLQRRNFFRLPVSAETPLKCVIAPRPVDPTQPQSVAIMDISVGGIALTCKGMSAPLEAGAIYPDCSIELPDIGTITATILVKNLFDVTSQSGAITKHAGCEFMQLDGKMSMLLQRYIGVMQSKLAGLR